MGGFIMKKVEKIEFPYVCESCIGPTKMIRIQKIPDGGICNITGLLYCVFRWKTDNFSRYKKTVICKSAAIAKRVCQVCLLDIETSKTVFYRASISGITSKTKTNEEEGNENLE